jgi:hypothetical protein
MAEAGGLSPAEVVDIVVQNILSDPFNVVLIAMGALLVGGSSLVLGYLSLGAVLSALGDLVPGGRSPPGQQEGP